MYFNGSIQKNSRKLGTNNKKQVTKISIRRNNNKKEKGKRKEKKRKRKKPV